MKNTLADVITALNLQHPGKWFIVGSFAVWIYAVVKEVNYLTKQDWELIVPGDIDIAISGGSESAMSLQIGGEVKTKVPIECLLWKSREKVGKDVQVGEVEFVWNDPANNLHAEAVSVAHLRLVPLDHLILRLGQGSAKGEKDKARRTREAVMKAHDKKSFDKFMSPEMGLSMFQQIANRRKD